MIPDFDTIECNNCSSYNDPKMLSLCGGCQEEMIKKINHVLDGRSHCKECKGHAINEIREIFKEFGLSELNEGDKDESN